MGDAKKTGIILAACAAAWVLIFLRSATGDGTSERREATVSQAEVQAFAKAELNKLQTRSFEEGAEFCAMVFENYSGELDISRTLKGSNHSCASLYVIEPGMLPLAGLHTHGEFDTAYVGETPSAQDVMVSASERVDGYVSTPGGRFWKIDWRSETAELICGERCLEQDPDFDRCEAFTPAESYTLKDLRFGPESLDLGC